MGPDCNFCQLTLFWPHVLKMEILIDGFAAAARFAGNFTNTGNGSGLGLILGGALFHTRVSFETLVVFNFKVP